MTWSGIGFICKGSWVGTGRRTVDRARAKGKEVPWWDKL